MDPAALWSSARRLHPIYAELAREFVIEVPACADLEAGVETPTLESIEQAQLWLNSMDEKIQVHQLRQFLQTSSLVDAEGLVVLLQHFLKAPRTDSSRDKIDFLLVQYFSQSAPTELEDNHADLAYVAQGLEPLLGTVELKAPVWLNALDRVLDSARRCRSLDELLHGGILDQGRKAKAQAGDLFYLPIALIAFTRFGYLMRRVFFRLMLADLNTILDGLTELEEKGVETIDCRRAQFSAQEPIIRLRMICQSWKVMFQAEYSSGQPLRMLVDLRASVDGALSLAAEGKRESRAASRRCCCRRRWQCNDFETRRGAPDFAGSGRGADGQLRRARCGCPRIRNLRRTAGMESGRGLAAEQREIRKRKGICTWINRLYSLSPTTWNFRGASPRAGRWSATYPRLPC